MRKIWQKLPQGTKITVNHKNSGANKFLPYSDGSVLGEWDKKQGEIWQKFYPKSYEMSKPFWN